MFITVHSYQINITRSQQQTIIKLQNKLLLKLLSFLQHKVTQIMKMIIT
jgi:hypothetical protein